MIKPNKSSVKVILGSSRISLLKVKQQKLQKPQTAISARITKNLIKMNKIMKHKTARTENIVLIRNKTT